MTTTTVTPQPHRHSDIDRALERHTGVITATIYNLLYTNDIISGYLCDAISDFRKSKHCRQQAKSLVNKIDKFRRAYERRIYDIVQDKAAFFADAADKFIEHSGIGQAISVLYISIKQRMDDCHVTDSALFARLETARALLDVSVQQYEYRMRDLRKVDAVLHALNMDYLCLMSADKLMNTLMDTFTFEGNIDMNTPRIRQAINSVAKRFADCDSIQESIKN